MNRPPAPKAPDFGSEPVALFRAGEDVVVLPLRTPTLPPATRTNCSIISGQHGPVVVDPGSPYPDEQARLLDALAGRPLQAIIATHHHHDHIGGLTALVASTGAPVYAHPQADLPVEFSPLIQGDSLPGASEWGVHHTPGHIAGHLVLHHRGGGVLIAGDMVAGTGTIVVTPPDGNMSHYLESLRRLLALDPQTMVPAHGPLISDPARLLDFYIEHRLWREQRVLEGVEEHPAPLMEITARAYTDVSPSIHGLASHSALAHLIRLETLGQIERCGEQTWRLIPNES